MIRSLGHQRPTVEQEISAVTRGDVFNRYNLSTIYSLKAEISTATPQQDAFIQKTGERTLLAIKNLFGDLIPDEKFERNQNLHNNIILTDDPRLASWGWVGKDHLIPDVLENPFTRTHATTGVEDELTFVLTPDAVNDSERSCLMSFRRNPQEDAVDARKKFEEEYLVRNIVHELLHQFHAEDLPEVFREMTVKHFEKQVLNVLGMNRIGFISDGIHGASIRNTLETHGDDVTRVFFGLPPLNSSKEAIFTDAEKWFNYCMAAKGL